MPDTSSGPALIPLGAHAGKPPMKIDRQVILIGARSNAHVSLVSQSVSNAHALIIDDGNAFYIRDLASRSGTIINGQPQHDVDLSDGDEIQIGKFVFKFATGGKERRPDQRPLVETASLEVDGSAAPIPIKERVVLIGRRENADISLVEESVSNAHAVIFEMRGTRYIRDLGSRTGTHVNGKPIHQAELQIGDKIRIGETNLSYVAGAEAAEDELEHLIGTAPLPGEEEPFNPDDVLLAPQPPAAAPSRAKSAPPPPEVEAEIDKTKPLSEPVEMAETELLQNEPISAPETEEANVIDLAPAAEEESAAPIPIEPEIDLSPRPLTKVPVAAPPAPTKPEKRPQVPVIDHETPAPPIDTDLETIPLAEPPIPQPKAWKEPTEPAGPPAESSLVEDLATLSPADLDVVLQPEKNETVSPLQRAEDQATASRPEKTVFPQQPAESPASTEIDGEAPSLSAAEAPEEEDLSSPEKVADVPVVAADAATDAVERKARRGWRAMKAAKPVEPTAPKPKRAKAKKPVELPKVEPPPPPMPVEDEKQEVAGEPEVFRIPEEPDRDADGGATATLDAPEGVLAPPPREDETLVEPDLGLSPRLSEIAREPEAEKTEAPEPISELDEVDFSALKLPDATEQAKEDRGQPLELDLAEEEPEAPAEEPILKLTPEAPSAKPEEPAPLESGELPLIAADAIETPVKREPTVKIERDTTKPPSKRPAKVQKTGIAPPKIEARGEMPAAEPVVEPKLEAPAPRTPTRVPEPIDEVDIQVEPTTEPELEEEVPSSEVIEKTEPTPESALDLDEAVAEALHDEVGEESLAVEPPPSDTSFGRAVTEFAGDAGEPVEVQEPSAAPEAPADEIALTEEEPAAPEAALDDTAPITATEPVADAGAPTAPAPEAPAAEKTPEEPAAEKPAPRGPTIFGLGANQDSFLGGIPLSMSGPTAPTAKIGEHFTPQPPSAAAPPPPPAPAAEAAPPTAPELPRQLTQPTADQPPPPRVAPPAPELKPEQRRKSRPAPPASFLDPFDAPKKEPEIPPFESKAPPTFGQVTTAFDGLAMPPVREADVFSQMSKPISAEDIHIPPATPRKDRSSARQAGDEHEPVAHEASPRVEPARRPPTIPAPTEKPRRRRWFGLRSIMIAMMLTMLLPSVGIYFLAPQRLDITGHVAFSKFAQQTPDVRQKISAEQEQLFLKEEFRRLAKDAFLKNNPHASAGFFADPVKFAKLTDVAMPIDPQGRLNVSVRSYDGVDPDRVRAVVDAMYTANAPYVTAADATRQEIENLKTSLRQLDSEMALLKVQIDEKKAILEDRPDDQKLAALKTEVASLQESYDNARDAVREAKRNYDAAVEAHRNADVTFDAAVPSPAEDPALQKLLADLEKINRQIAPLRKTRDEQVAQARQEFDSQAAAAEKQLAADNAPQLAQYFSSAKQYVIDSRQRIVEMLQAQKDSQAKSLELTQRVQESLDARRQELLRGDDKELQELVAQRDLARRRLNAATDNKLEAEITPAREELASIEAKIETKLQSMGLITEDIAQLQKVVADLKIKSAESIQNTQQVISAAFSALAQSAPAVQTIDEAQQKALTAAQEKLAEFNASRDQYFAALVSTPGDSAVRLVELETQAAALQAKIDNRQKELGDEIASKRLADQHRQTNAELTQKQAALESIKQMMVDAEKTYLDRHRLLQEELAREARAVQAGAEHDQLLGKQTDKFKLKQVRENKLESDLRKLDNLVEPVRPQPNNVTVADTDMRPQFILYWIGIVTAFFLVLIAVNFTAPAASPSHDDVEAVGHAMVEDYEVPSPPPHTTAHPKPVIPVEPTRV